MLKFNVHELLFQEKEHNKNSISNPQKKRKMMHGGEVKYRVAG